MMIAQESSGLLPPAFRPLPLGQIRPAGWLCRQLRIQANGLTGHLDEFWPDVAESGWIGGQAEGWERGPYWLDGVVPLAYLLDDERLKAKAQRWIDYVLDHQLENGWLGPVRDTAKGDRYQAYDPWPVFVFLKALAQFQEATGDSRVIPAMQRFLCFLSHLLGEKPLYEWGRHRWADLVLSIHWLYERTEEPWLLALAAKARSQGYDWGAHFAAFRYTRRLERDGCSLATHVVNNAMAIKALGVGYRQSRDTGDAEGVFQSIDCLDTHHGQVTGLFSGDEHYAGRNPSQGTELCAVVEYMFSLEVLLSILGDSRHGDRLERIALNALPATFKPDMWAHQYDQQANQVICKISEDRIYVSNGPDANIFGLEPNYGCCTANMHQGWPKFASHLWMKTPDEGLVAVGYAPSVVQTTLRGLPVRVALETDYPFGETLEFTVRVPEPVRLPLILRVPAWADGATVTVEGEAVRGLAGGCFARVEREWQDETKVTLRLPMAISLERRYHDSVSITRGPLVYSLRIDEDWRLVKGVAPHADWEVYPTSPWNYGLGIDEEHPEDSICVEARPVGDCPFSPEGAPMAMHLHGRRLPGWHIQSVAAGPIPQSPVVSEEPLEALELIPYGCTNLRVTEFPMLSMEGQRDSTAH